MIRRTYNQYCALAHALDRVGERWTLLILRELLIGPRRYKDLLAALPGIGTNLLAARLRQLKREEILNQTTLPPPAGSTVYQLTEAGRKLEPALLALMKWGRRTLGPPRKGQFAHPAWAVLAMKSTFRPEAARGVHEVYQFHVDDVVFHARVEDGTAKVTAGPHPQPDLVLHAANKNFLALGTGQLTPRDAVASGAVRIEGKISTLRRALKIFGIELQR